MKKTFTALLCSVALACISAPSHSAFNSFFATTSSAVPALPSGVTALPPDGGQTYYATNNFTNASSSITFKGVTYTNGWDSPGFIAVGTWLTPFGPGAITGVGGITTIAGEFVDLGFNTHFTMGLGSFSGNMARARANGISVVFQHNELGSLLAQETPGTELVGINNLDEPESEMQAIKLAVLGNPTTTFTGTVVGNVLTTGVPSGGEILWRFDANALGPPYITGSPTPLNPNITITGAGTGNGHNNGGTYSLATPNVGPETMTQAAMPAVASAQLDNHFLWTNYLNAIFSGGNLAGITPTTLSSNLYGPNNRHIDVISTDLYWISWANNNGANAQSGSNIYQAGQRPMTVPEMARGSHYGDLIDFMRVWQTGHFPAPLSTFIEIGNGKTGIPYSTAPQELNWTVWSTIVHGARFVMYFQSDDGNAPSTGGFGGDNMQNPYFQVAQFATFSGSISGTTLTATGTITGPSTNPPSGSPGWIFPGLVCTSGCTGSPTILQQTNNFATPGKAGTYTITGGATGSGTMTFTQPNIPPNVGGTITGSMYNQVKSTNAMLAAMGPLINSQFASGFVTVSPNGYNKDIGAGTQACGTLQSFACGIATGIEVMAKYYTGSTYTAAGYNVVGDSIPPGFYIFATTRNNETDVSTSATFTLCAACTGFTTATVIGESRSLPISARAFTDTFANAWTVHIYKIQ